MAERRDLYRVLVGKHGGKRPVGSPGLNWKIILKYFFRKWGRGTWMRLIWFGIWTGGRQVYAWY